jgi:hypothetical protein
MPIFIATLLNSYDYYSPFHVVRQELPMMYHASNDEHIRDDIRQNDKSTDKGDLIRLPIIDAFFSTKSLSPNTPKFSHRIASHIEDH